MLSPRVPDFVPRTPIDNPGKRSGAGRIALVTTLAGCGIAALAVINTPAPVHGRDVEPAEVRAATSDIEAYFPARFTLDAKASDTGIVTFEHD